MTFKSFHLQVTNSDSDAGRLAAQSRAPGAEVLTANMKLQPPICPPSSPGLRARPPTRACACVSTARGQAANRKETLAVQTVLGNKGHERDEVPTTRPERAASRELVIACVRACVLLNCASRWTSIYVQTALFAYFQLVSGT